MLAILGGLCLIPFVLAFPETCRGVVGNGSVSAASLNSPFLPFLKPQADKPPDDKVGSRLRWIPNPLKCVALLLKKEESLIMGSNALFYMNYSVLQAALATLLMNTYGLNSLQAGLCYLPYGIASAFSSYIVGK